MKQDQQKIRLVENSNSHDAIIDSPIGHLGIQVHGNQLKKIDFLTNKSQLIAPAQTITIKIAKQLEKYFANHKHRFSLTFDLQGTDFLKQVWQALSKIPVGTTLSYGALAKQLKTSPRAIGNACRRNPIPIVIPCHRIVAQQHLGGFSGALAGRSLQIKTWLLQHEKYL